MKIIVTHVFSDENKGDAALLSVLLSDMKKMFNNPDMTILSMDKIEAGELFEEVPVKNSFMFYSLNYFNNRLLKLVHSIFIITYTLLWASVYRLVKIKLWLPKHLKEVTELYSEADLVVSVGGGYLRGKPDTASTILLILLSHPFLLTRIFNKPSVIYPQSVGPFGSRLQELIVRYCLKSVNLIFVREDISFALLKQLGLNRNLVRSIDSGFAFQSNSNIDLRSSVGILNDRPVVGVTVRSWLKKEAQFLYEKSVAVFLTDIAERYGVNIVFIPQVTAVHHNDDDREVSKRIYELMKKKDGVFVMNEVYNHHIIKSIYSQVDYIVGTRFHSVIFSLTSGVPAIAIEYEHKTSGIMHDLNLDEWVVKIEDVTAEKLSALFDKLVIQKKKYVNHLIEILPEYIAQTKSVPVLVKESYEKDVESNNKCE